MAELEFLQKLWVSHESEAPTEEKQHRVGKEVKKTVSKKTDGPGIFCLPIRFGGFCFALRVLRLQLGKR